MSKCPCDPPKKPEPPWTPIPGKNGAAGSSPTASSSDSSASLSDLNAAYQKQPDEILPGENIDCYMRRAGNKSGKMNDVAEKPPNKIANTSLTSDLDGKVNTFFKLTPSSPEKAVTWRIWFDGTPGVPSGMGLTFNTSTGQLSGQVTEQFLNKNYKVLVKAFKNDTEEVDSREFNFFPKKGKKDDTIKFVFPYSPKDSAVITSGFGPRKHPVTGEQKAHRGIDISQPGTTLGDILAAADGIVTYVGPGTGYGNYVKIDHKDSTGKLVATTLYAHMKLSEIYVQVGQKVSAGQKIAKEGNEGVGTAAHLHFELHKNGFKNPVDPVPYINGTFAEAQDNLPGQEGVPDPGTIELINNVNAGMTRPESQAALDDCPKRLPNQAGDTGGTPPPDPTTSPISPQPPLTPEPPTVPVNPSTAEVQQAIQRALDEDPTLTDADKKHLMFVAKIESGFDADAKNPTSSARGVYQMLDKTADAYYRRIGVAPTIENRNDPYLATKAQIEFYKREQKPYWEEFRSQGTIAGKQLSPDVQERYAGLSQGEFTYGLIHHDGVGNAVKGIDRQGVDYYRKKIREVS